MLKVVELLQGQKQRKAYAAPRLVVHGDVAKITQRHPRPCHRGEGPESQLS